MNKRDFYNGNDIIQKKDLDGYDPFLFFICGNRTAGKTFWCKKFLMDRFIKYGEQFVILVRFGYQMKGMADTIMNDMITPYPKYKEHMLKEKVIMKEGCVALEANEQVYGYVVALNAADNIKRLSGMFAKVRWGLLDEFQSENGKYCPDEINKFQSVVYSINRGNGEFVRNLQVFMCSNMISLLNPYFSHFGIGARINIDTRFLKGKGWVCEFTHNDNATEAFNDSAMGRCFSGTKYAKMGATNIYLNDNYVFIDKMPVDGKIYLVLKYEGKSYGVWACHSVIYISKKYDPSYKNIVALTINDHTPEVSSRLLIGRDTTYLYLREVFQRGLVRFEDLECKQAFFTYLGYDD